MKFLNTIAVLAFSAFVTCFADDDDAAVSGDEAVYTLTTDMFDSFIAEHGKVLVEFYAPWCGHCKALTPEYEAAAQKIHSDESLGTVLAKVDATEEKDLATKYGVRGFPTLKYFTGDVENPSDYGGGRTESTILSWLEARALPPVSNLASNDELDAFKTKSRVVLVAYMSDDDKVKPVTELAEKMRDSLVVGRMSNTDAIGSIDGVNDGDIYIYRQFDEPQAKFEGSSVTLDELVTFVNGEKFPLIDAIGPENYAEYIDRGLPLVWIAIDLSEETQLADTIATLTPYAIENKGKLSFTYVDNSKYGQHVSNLGITEIPGLLIVGEEKFLLKEKLTEDNVKSFFDSYASGKLDAYMKTQDIPESNDDDVFVLVGKNFKTVIGSDKDVFVEFYAPWCGHCKRLAPEYEKVGATFKDVDNMVVAKIDATENDTPEEIKGFPTLIFYPAGTKEGEKYNGERTADAIIEFLKKKATVDVSNVKEEL